MELVRQRREALGLSQKEAARRAGISREEWSGMENGRRGIGPVNAARFVAVLGGERDEYLTRPLHPDIIELRREVADLRRRIENLEKRRSV